MVAMLVLASCGQASQPPVPAAPSSQPSPATPPQPPQPSAARTKVKVGFSTPKDFEFAAAYLGVKQGFWSKRGLDVENVFFNSGGQAVQGLAAGDVEIVATGASSGAAAILKGLKARIVGDISRSFNLFYLVGSPKLAYNSPADLKGKVIGITSHGSVTDYLVNVLAANQKWDLDRDIKKAPIGGFAEQVAALKAGNTHAFIWSGEGALDLQDKGEAKVLLNFGEITGSSINLAILASQTAIQNKPEMVKAYLEGWYETADYIKKNRAAVIQFLTEQFQMAPATAAKVYDSDVANLSSDGNPPAANLQAVADSLVILKAVEKAPAVDTFWDPRFVPIKVGG